MLKSIIIYSIQYKSWPSDKTNFEIREAAGSASNTDGLLN